LQALILLRSAAKRNKKNASVRCSRPRDGV
jgi:hypothetical protein